MRRGADSTFEVGSHGLKVSAGLVRTAWAAVWADGAVKLLTLIGSGASRRRVASNFSLSDRVLGRVVCVNHFMV
jgi:hypothetical protein